MTAPRLKCGVERTLYEAGVTQRGSACFIVSYYTEGGEVIKQWLFPGPKLEEWWDRRSGKKCPSTCEAIADLATRGAVLPTKSITYKREGRWPNVISTEIGKFPEAFGQWMSEVREIFGDVEVIKVIA